MSGATSWVRRALPYAAITAVGMLATDLYLPALPSVGRAMGATVEATQASLSAFLVGLAISQLPWGRAADRLGARASLLFGLGIFVVASVGCVLAPSMPWLVAMRALEGVGAGATTVIVPVLIHRDFESDEAVVALSWVGIAESIIPAVGPILGALLLLVGDYRLSFALVALLGAALALEFARRDEAVAADPRPAEPGRLGARFARFALSHALALGSLIAFVGSAPQLIALRLGLGANAFAAMQVCGVLGFALSASRTGARLARYGRARTVAFGVVLQIVGGALVAGSDVLPVSAAFVVAGWVSFCAGMGIRGPVIFAAALDVPTNVVGTASAAIMLGCQAAAALGTQALAPTLEGGFAPTGMLLALCAGLSYAVLPSLAVQSTEVPSVSASASASESASDPGSSGAGVGAVTPSDSSSQR